MFIVWKFPKSIAGRIKCPRWFETPTLDEIVIKVFHTDLWFRVSIAQNVLCHIAMRFCCIGSNIGMLASDFWSFAVFRMLSPEVDGNRFIDILWCQNQLCFRQCRMKQLISKALWKNFVYQASAIYWAVIANVWLDQSGFVDKSTSLVFVALFGK